ncbi:MAG TPA: DinB family protein [Dehalococcoidia bacterium]|nr:DinB family protein [Dehalococcoidia bacterium]
MTAQRETYLEKVRSIRNQMLAVLDGMDYCLDWKPDAASWSVREVVYHLVDTPDGGLHTLISGILSGQTREFDLTPDLNHMNPERQTFDMSQVRRDIAQVLDGLEAAVSAADDEALTTVTVLAHRKARGVDEECTPQILLEGLFARHWQGHGDQLRELRETLGI